MSEAILSEAIPHGDFRRLNNLRARLYHAYTGAKRSEHPAFAARLHQVDAALNNAQRRRPLRPEDREAQGWRD